MQLNSFNAKTKIEKRAQERKGNAQVEIDGGVMGLHVAA